MRKLKLIAVAAVASMALALALAAMPPGGPSVNLSGYEFMLGTSCQIGTCGVQFGGWTQNSNLTDWTTFPGNGKGLWKATVNYSNSPGFGNTVNIQSGSFDVFFKNGKRVSGTIESGGTVTWPRNEGDPGCGGVTNAATISLTLTLQNGGTGYFQGCLLDIPAGSVIPPKEWGTLYY